jgi:hypothetical protein
MYYMLLLIRWNGIQATTGSWQSSKWQSHIRFRLISSPRNYIHNYKTSRFPAQQPHTHIGCLEKKKLFLFLSKCIIIIQMQLQYRDWMYINLQQRRYLEIWLKVKLRKRREYKKKTHWNNECGKKTEMCWVSSQCRNDMHKFELGIRKSWKASTRIKTKCWLYTDDTRETTTITTSEWNSWQNVATESAFWKKLNCKVFVYTLFL